MTVLGERPLDGLERATGDLPGGPGAPRVGRLVRSIWRGRAADPGWVRPLLLLLLVGTAFIYLVDLDSNGWANSFYSGAVQAATKSWKALFFGSSDAANYITVDKPPASLWVMDLSARAFGLNSWSVLVPQALEGVACVAGVYATARRAWSAGTALLAGLLFALTPVAALMFRFNNPDALLVLLLVLAAYATMRAVQSDRLGWLLLAALLVGVGFNTKMLQAFLVVPAFGVAYLVAGRPGLSRRLLRLAAAGAVLLVSSAWWIITVDLVPASQRPFVGGSGDNRELSLVFGYNGLGRLSGHEAGSLVAGKLNEGSGRMSLLRLFKPEFGVDIAWLIPAACVAFAVGIYLTRSHRRTDTQRASLLLMGVWLAVTAATFSLGRGTIHPYYSVALAPAVASLVAPGVTLLWAHRSERRARLAAAAMVLVTLGYADELFAQTFATGLGRQLALASTIVPLVIAIASAPRLHAVGRKVVFGTTAALCLLGPVVTTVIAVRTPQHTALPIPAPPSSRVSRTGAAVNAWLLVGRPPSPQVAALLRENARLYTWAAATAGSEQAASFQLAIRHPVMAVGGFNGTDAAPTLAQFKTMAGAHRIHWFVAGPLSATLVGSQAAAIASWVQQRFPETDVDGFQLFDLSMPTSYLRHGA